MCTGGGSSALSSAERDGVIFVDPGDFITGDDLSFYDADQLHPSISGAEAVGRMVAEEIAAAEVDSALLDRVEKLIRTRLAGRASRRWEPGV